MAMTLVETVTVGSGGAASIVFSSVPQSGKDLLLLYSIRTTGTTNLVRVRFNSDTANNYVILFLTGNGSTATSSTPGATTSSFPLAVGTSDLTANTFGNGAAYVANYTSSTSKSFSSDVVNENNATAATTQLGAGRYTPTNAVTSLSIVGADDFVQHSTASLYIIS